MTRATALKFLSSSIAIFVLASAPSLVFAQHGGGHGGGGGSHGGFSGGGRSFAGGRSSRSTPGGSGARSFSQPSGNSGRAPSSNANRGPAGNTAQGYGYSGRGAGSNGVTQAPRDSQWHSFGPQRPGTFGAAGTSPIRPGFVEGGLGRRPYPIFGRSFFGLGFGGFGWGFGYSPCWGFGWADPFCYGSLAPYGYGYPYAYPPSVGYDPNYDPSYDPGYDPRYDPNYDSGAPNYNPPSASSSSEPPNSSPSTPNRDVDTAVNTPRARNQPDASGSVIIYFKDGTTVSPSDYWLGDGQFHYVVAGRESAVDLDRVDLAQSNAENQRRGVAFVLRSVPDSNASPEQNDNTPPNPTAKPQSGPDSRPTPTLKLSTQGTV